MHLQNMCYELQIVKPLIADHDTVMFALFYHDIVYKATAKNNEEKSAEKAIEVLNFLNYPEEKKLLCAQHILATKSHDTSSNADTNFLLDADMSIPGKPWPEYEAYFKAVCKEYAIYPDFLYNPGRRKVLHYFLSMDAIYKTPEFKDRYEKVARTNIEKELLLYH
ncbi:hypothetical protein GR160_06015 [Flavobacterium sp. Sd200]|uniref:HD domain-containing protein n=1 Tax=Flavobacterium sp. Sd200 TaxID=2692211 RepID=UPI001368ABC7|nr:hypothetical protein [Flavobacterium sp. Sd200]MXN90776.1 hypothetical protein [Flavobacterium sp. Sd200]